MGDGSSPARTVRAQLPGSAEFDAAFGFVANMSAMAIAFCRQAATVRMHDHRRQIVACSQTTQTVGGSESSNVHAAVDVQDLPGRVRQISSNEGPHGASDVGRLAPSLLQCQTVLNQSVIFLSDA